FSALNKQTEEADFILDFTNTQVSAMGIPDDVAGTLNPATVKIGSAASMAPTTTPKPTVSPSPVATPTPVSSPTPVASNNSNSVILEAETMSLVANSQALQVFSDTQASGSKGMVFFSNATSTGTFNTAATLTRFNVRARGDMCKGGPV